MKKLLFLSIFVLTGLLAFFVFIPATAQATANSPIVLCLPGVHLDHPDECTPAGPSSYINFLAQKGVTLPIPPLPATPIDPALSQVNMRYAEVRNNNAPVYGSPGDASQNKPKSAVQHMSGDFVFISYTDEQELNGRHLYMIGPNAWMVGNDLSRISVLPRSQGVTFNRTPSHAFGWILTYWVSEPLQTKRTPGKQNDDYTGNFPQLYDIVPVFAEEKVGEDTWYMIGPEEWAPARYVARVIPNTTPPAGVSGERWIEVNLLEQTLAVYDHRQLVFATIIASGADPFWTQPGVFQIQKKLASTPMTGATAADRSDAYYLEDVPWTMYYDGPRALHGAYWRAKMGFPQSHGCVNLTVGDAHWLFDWAQEGDWVYVWDPSGKTPTDPKLYSTGGY